MPPTISVFIALYNQEKYIGQAISSVLAQTNQDVEVCIYDDGSADRSTAIVEEYASRFPGKIKVELGIKNRGAVYAYNAALKMCTGDYVAQLDSDDVLPPNALAMLARVLDQRPEIGLVCSDYEYIDAAGAFYAEGVYPKTVSDDELRRMMLNKTCAIYHLRMFRRELLNKIADWCTDPFHLCADYDLYIKLAEITNVMKVPEVLYQQRWHAGNISHQRMHQQLSARLVQLRSARRRIKRISEKITSPLRPALAVAESPASH